MRHLHPYAGQREDSREEIISAPCEHELEMERAEREIDELRSTVRKLEAALRAAHAVVSPYARKENRPAGHGPAISFSDFTSSAANRGRMESLDNEKYIKHCPAGQ